jgi:hypothetical protein
VARRVFFSFHFENDAWRAAQVRNSWVTKGEQAGYVDAAQWEAVKKGGDAAVRRWIDQQLNGTSVTAVLIGAETYWREYVLYEIEKSVERGNGIVGIHVSSCKDPFRQTSQRGPNPLDRVSIPRFGRHVTLSSLVHTYDWVLHNGYANLSKWVEDAAIQAGR